MHTAKEPLQAHESLAEAPLYRAQATTFGTAQHQDAVICRGPRAVVLVLVVKGSLHSKVHRRLLLL